MQRFGAEEAGKVGSKYYISTLDQQDLDEILFYINTDMIGSPNYVLGVFNTSHLDKISISLQSNFENFLKQNNFSYDLVEMGGGSDYQSFVDVGVPSGGFNTGLNEMKTVEEKKKFGGIANAFYDPCYHKSCDTYDNINQVVLDQISQTITHSISFFGKMEDVRNYMQN